METQGEIEKMRARSGNISYADRLTHFIYLLIRDELPSGKVERLMVEVEKVQHAILYTNGWAAQHAFDIAMRLKETDLTNSDATAEIINVEFEDRFEDFWTAYPNKVNRLDAERAWSDRLRAEPDLDIDQLLIMVGRYRVFVAAKPGLTVMNPGNWLRNKRDADDLTTP